MRVVDDKIADPRFPEIKQSDLSSLFGNAWVTGTDPQEFIDSWNTPQVKLLATLLLQGMDLPVTSPIPAPVPLTKFLDTIGTKDLNCDGKSDIAIVDPKRNLLRVMAGKGDGSFLTPVEYAVGKRPSALAVADFNLDARFDIVVAESEDNSIRLFQNDQAGCGTLLPKPPISVGRYPVSLAVSDLNNDSRPDVVVANRDDGTISVLFGVGNGDFLAEPPINVGPNPSLITIQDSVGSTASDILVATAGNNGVKIFGNDGTGTFTADPQDFGLGFSPNPFIWTGSALKYDFGSFFSGGINGPGCKDTKRLYSQYQNIRTVQVPEGLPNVPHPIDVEAIVGTRDPLKVLGLGEISVCRGFNIAAPSMDCQTKKRYFKMLTGKTPEQMLIEAIPGLPSTLKDFLLRRFDVCKGFDLSKLTCKEIISLTQVLANLTIPALGALLSNPIAEFIIGQIFCKDLNLDFELPDLPDIEISFPYIDFSGPDFGRLGGFGGHCWFGCGKRSGGGGGGGSGTGVTWFGLQGSDLSCASLPQNVASLTYGDLFTLAATTGKSIGTVMSSVISCTSPTAVPGFPDLNVPSVTLLTPSDGQVVGSSVVVSGFTNDASAAVYTNGTVVPTVHAAEGLWFEETIPIPANRIVKVEAIDQAGNVGVASATVVAPLTSELGINFTASSVFAVVGMPTSIVFNISENSGYAGATAIVTLREQGRLLAEQFVSVPAGQSVSVTLQATFASAGLHTITATLENIMPNDNVSTNNTVDFDVFVSASEIPQTPAGVPWAWGSNQHGQLGDGTLISKTSPVTVVGIADAVAIEAGYGHSVALKDDRTVWAWGWNASVQKIDISDVVEVAAGYGHTLALKADGTVWAWGSNWFGQLGDGTMTDRSIPVQVIGISGASAIAAGEHHSLALKTDGTVWAWGWNVRGQLGDGTVTGRSIPVQVLGLNSVITVAAGTLHSLALQSDGTVWAWGWNAFGQLGDGTTISSSTPVQVTNLHKAGAIAAGSHHSFALKADGTVWAWGINRFGQLGDGTTTDRSVPLQVIEINNISAVAAGQAHSLALRTDGTVWAWGYNGGGQLGNGTVIDKTTPIQVIGIRNVFAIAAGYLHSLALTVVAP